MKYSGQRKLSKLNPYILHEYYTNTDSSILVYKFRPERTDFIYVRRVYATAINIPCITTLITSKYSIYSVYINICLHPYLMCTILINVHSNLNSYENYSPIIETKLIR